MTTTALSLLTVLGTIAAIVLSRSWWPSIIGVAIWFIVAYFHKIAVDVQQLAFAHINVLLAEVGHYLRKEFPHATSTDEALRLLASRLEIPGLIIRYLRFRSEFERFDIKEFTSKFQFFEIE